MTAPNPQQMQSRNESVNTSTVRRRAAMSALLGGRSHFADGDQGQLDSGLSESHTIAGVNTNALLHAFAVYIRAKGAVIEKHQLVAVMHESAVAPRNSGEPVGQRDIAGGIRGTAADHQRVSIQGVGPAIPQHM